MRPAASELSAAIWPPRARPSETTKRNKTQPGAAHFYCCQSIMSARPAGRLLVLTTQRPSYSARDGRSTPTRNCSRPPAPEPNKQSQLTAPDGPAGRSSQPSAPPPGESARPEGAARRRDGLMVSVKSRELAPAPQTLPGARIHYHARQSTPAEMITRFYGRLGGCRAGGRALSLSRPAPLGSSRSLGSPPRQLWFE